jgi:hypothetical protein
MPADDLASVVDDYLTSLHQREAERDSPESLRGFVAALEKLVGVARVAPPATLDRLLKLLSVDLAADASHWRFGFVAQPCGMLVEWGGDPALVLEAILDRIERQFAEAPAAARVFQEELGIDEPIRVEDDQWPAVAANHPGHAALVSDWLMLGFTGRAAMTMLCSRTELRHQARTRAALWHAVDAARAFTPYAFYLAETLALADDESLLILDTTRRLGFRVRLVAIRNNHHFFTLLQDTLLSHPTGSSWTGKRGRPLLTALAKCERTLADITPEEWAAEDAQYEFGVEDEALWSYHTWPAMKVDGTLQSLSESPDLPFAVWGEQKPSEIPAFDGERIVLLGPLEFPRRWSLQYFAPLHRSLRPGVEIVEQLEEEEYARWIEKLKSSQAPG